MRPCVWVSLLIFIVWVYRGDVPFILILYSYGSIEMGAINVVCAIFFHFSLAPIFLLSLRIKWAAPKAILTHPNKHIPSRSIANTLHHFMRVWCDCGGKRFSNVYCVNFAGHFNSLEHFMFYEFHINMFLLENCQKPKSPSTIHYNQPTTYTAHQRLHDESKNTKNISKHIHRNKWISITFSM